jgi:dTDP-4-dehydrorhamnose 3,5-epimerase
MIVLETPFKGLYEIELSRMGDNRGWFMRTFDLEIFQKNIDGFDCTWKQMNHSFNLSKYTWRGFHYQESPYQETKLVRCIRGSVLDCVIDLRINSETYLKTFQLELSYKNGKMLYIPKGFAHGFLTLEDNVELTYLHDEYYRPDFEKGIRYNDPKIDFSLPFQPLIISERDKKHLNII